MSYVFEGYSLAGETVLASSTPPPSGSRSVFVDSSFQGWVAKRLHKSAEWSFNSSAPAEVIEAAKNFLSDYPDSE